MSGERTRRVLKERWGGGFVVGVNELGEDVDRSERRMVGGLLAKVVWGAVRSLAICGVRRAECVLRKSGSKSWILGVFVTLDFCGCGCLM